MAGSDLFTGAQEIKRNLVLIVLIGAMLNVRAAAQMCGPQERLAVEFDSSAFVFTGTAKSVTVRVSANANLADAGPPTVSPGVPRQSPGSRQNNTLITFDVETWWKGSGTPTIEIRTCGGGGTDCPMRFQFEKGVQYVVFATASGFTTACHRTKRLKDAAPTLQWLAGKKTWKP